MLSLKTDQRYVLYIPLSIVLGFTLAASFLFHSLLVLTARNIKLIIFPALLLSSLIGLAIIRWIVPVFSTFPMKIRIALLSGAMFAGAWFVFAIPLFSEIHRKRDIALLLSDVFTLSFLFFSGSLWLFSRPMKSRGLIEIPRWTCLLYATPMVFVWTLFLLAYWPGTLSFDSVSQWNQMATFKFTDWHPVFHTLTNWLITRIWPSPAAIVLVQIMAMSLVLGWGLAEQRRFGAPPWLPWLTILIIIAIPANGLIVITLWKDVFYSISIVALTVILFKIALTYGKWMLHRNLVFLLTLVSAFVALFRHNGAPVAFGTLVILMLSYRQLWKVFLIALVLTFTIWLGIRWPLYDALKVDRTSPMSSQPGVGMALLHLIARYTNTNTVFLPQERELLFKIRPDEKWPYVCELETTLFQVNWVNLKKYTPTLAALSLKLIYRDPRVFVDHVLCTSSFIYQITRTHESLYEPMETGVYPNDFGIVRASKFIALKNILDKVPDQANQSFNWFLWRVPLWGYLLLSGLITYGFRSKNWKVLLVFAPIFLNMLPFTIMAVLQSFRYVYSTLLVGVLMSGYFLCTDTSPTSEEN